MKRTLAAAMTAIVLVVGLSACSGGGGSQTAFCDLLKVDQAKIASADPTDSANFSEYTAAVAELVSKAPSEIKADLQKIATFAAAYAKDPKTVPDPTIATSFTNVAKYATDKCGVNLSGSTDSQFSTVGSAVN